MHRLVVPAACSFALVLAGCEKNTEFLQPAVEPEPTAEIFYENVDAELQTYFKAFEEEAAERGIEVDLSAMNLTGHLVEIADEGVAGECRYDETNPNRVSVDRETWDAVSPLLREFIVFHELGHCERLRNHREDADANGTCVSIMASGTGDCTDRYTRARREELLDELFDEEFYGEWP